MARIKYNTETNIIEAADSGMEILHADSVDTEIIGILVDMYNEDYSIKKIEDKLLQIAEKGSKITTDEVEYLIEQLTIFDDSIAGQPISAVPAVTKTEPIPEPITDNKMEEQKPVNTVQETTVEQPTIQIQENTDISATTETESRRKRKSSSVDSPKRSSGSISPQDLIAKYQEKIDITQALSGIVIPEIVTGALSKDGERLIKELHVAYQKLINEYLIKVQEL